MQPIKPGHVYTDKDWNDYAVREVEKKGKDAAGKYKYRASKVLSERGKVYFEDKEELRTYKLQLLGILGTTQGHSELNLVTIIPS